MKDNTKKHKVIGVLVAGIQDEFVDDCCTALNREAVKRGFKVLIFGTFNNMYYDNIFSKGESSIFSLINPELLDALVVLPESIKNEAVRQKVLEDAKGSGLPVITVNQDIPGTSSIVFDYRDTFEKIVRHVIEDHGCRAVNFIAGQKGNPFSEERLDCYKRVLADNGIEYDETRVGYGDFWEVPTNAVMDRFLADERGVPQAIICCNDTMAIVTCRRLRDAGYSVPEDVIVTGFDGIELEKYVMPRLTTAELDNTRMAGIALDLIEQSLEGLALPETTVIPFKMRRSESCGCVDIPDITYSEKILELYNKIESSKGHEDHMFAYVYHTVEFMDLDSMGEAMARFADHYTWVCLNTDFIRDDHETERYHEHYTQNMLMLMKCVGKKTVRNVVFPTEWLLPDLDEELMHHNVLMFMPMHFQNEIMGYMAVSVGLENFNFNNTHRFLNNTNQIFENLKNRTRLQTAYAQMSDMLMRDPMTNIYNRRGFYARAAEMAEKYGDSVVYVLFSADLDGLKQINDTYGHSMGDIALMEASKVIDGGCGKEWVCARFGGDEFVVLAAADDAVNCISTYTVRVQRELDSYNRSHGNGFEVGVSLGAEVLAGLPDQETIDEAMRQADRKMYVEKKRHHNSR